MKYRRTQQGFTLIEVAITIFIVGALVALFATAINVTKLTRDVKYEDVALHIATNKLEELRNSGYASIPASGPFNDALLAELPLGVASTTVSAYNAKTKKVIITVGWLGNAGNLREQSLTTLITETGGL